MKEFKMMINQLRDLNAKSDAAIEDSSISEEEYDKLLDKLFALQDKVISYLTKFAKIDEDTAHSMVTLSRYRERLYAIADRI